MLFSLLSKIHFESKSQRREQGMELTACCFLFCQRYILKANHNIYCIIVLLLYVVFSFVKDTFWKQITTSQHLPWRLLLLFSLLSKIHFESKSQRFLLINKSTTCCFLFCQRYILKANHNLQFAYMNHLCVVFSFVKDTFWKQITTIIEVLNW